MARSIPALGMALAGAIHLVLAQGHYTHAPAHDIFFLLAGIAEIAWALFFHRRPSPRLFLLGLAMAGGLVVLWAITRIAPAPFEHEASAVDVGGLACKGSELASILALAFLAVRGEIVGLTRLPPVRIGAIALAAALVSGAALYTVGHAMEPLQPLLGPPQGEGHSGAGHADGGSVPETTSGHGEAESPLHEPNGLLAATLGPLRVEDPWARPAPAGANGVAYLTLVNASDEAVRLVAAASEVAAVDIMQSSMEGDVMRMGALPGGVDVPAGGTLELKPGGYHLMLMGLRQELTAGEVISLTLYFEGLGDLVIQAEVRQP
jgi:hypothetical protein